MAFPRFALRTFDQIARPYWLASFVKSYLAVGARAGVSDVHDLEQALLHLGSSEQRERFIESLHAVPEMDAMLRRRFVPEPYTIESLAAHAPGTLGYAYYRHMSDNGLGRDYYAYGGPSDEFEYFRMRSVQTHDIHHALTGFAPDRLGEMGVIHFYLGNYSKLGTAGPDAMIFVSLVASAVVLNFAMTTAGELPALFDRIGSSIQLGRKADLVLGVDWERHFAKPLDEVRTEFHITPASAIYDFDGATIRMDTARTERAVA